MFKQSPDGDIIDCVHISNQPAFDHPFLKDHKIQVSTISQFCTFFKYFFSTCPEVLYHLTLYQTRPTYHPEGLFDENKVSEKPKEITNPINQLWHANGRCPENTIPIRRTKEDDVLRASSVKRYGKKRHRAIPQPRSADPDLINQSGHQVILLPFKYNQSFFFCLIFFTVVLISWCSLRSCLARNSLCGRR